MENSIYLGLSKQLALQTNMDIIANNIANMNTSGYRGQNLLFDEVLEKQKNVADNYDDTLSFVLNRGQYENTTPGPVKQTGNPLDVYLDGPGFMGVISPDGTVSYTRAGDMQINANGTLVNSVGYPIADNGGAIITIPIQSTEIRIDEQGLVSDQNGQIGQIQIVEFNNPQTLAAQGNGLYTTDEQGVFPANTRVRQGALEGSNVQPIVEMTRMIDTLRSFQNVHNMMKTENERLLGVIEKLTSRG